MHKALCTSLPLLKLVSPIALSVFQIYSILEANGAIIYRFEKMKRLVSLSGLSVNGSQNNPIVEQG